MKRLAIVGTHTRTRELAPFDNPEFDIWVFNESPQKPWVKRWDLCFQLHKREVYESPYNFVQKDHWDWLQQAHGKPIYMQDVDERVPDSVRYPLDEIIASVPGAKLKWFKSSFAYATALALYMGYEHIDFYGADMASNTEYGYQLPNFQFWVAICLGAGIEIDVIANERFFTGTLYAYEGEVQIPQEHFDKRIADLTAEERHAKNEVDKISRRVVDAVLEFKVAKVQSLLTDWQTVSIDHGTWVGRLDEAKRYGGRDDLVPRQEYERTAAQAQIDAEQAKQDMWITRGEAQYVWNIWKDKGNEAALKQLRLFSNKMIMQSFDFGVRTGVMKENMDYMTLVSDLITAAGGQKTLAALGVA